MGNSIAIEQITSEIEHMATIAELESTKNAFKTLLTLLPQSWETYPQISGIFSSFSHEKVKGFSNSLISLMEFQMSSKLAELNKTADLALVFVQATYQKFKSMNELIPFAYNDILEKGEKASEVIKKSFPFNLFIFCVNTLNNDEFMYKKDVFQKELDKFDFIHKITNITFIMINNSSKVKNVSNNTLNYIDTFKLFILNNKNVFISKERQENFIKKLYNTSINNFDILINKRYNPNITKQDFESFLFMNFFILLYLLEDNVTYIFQSKNYSNTFNLKSEKVLQEILKGENIEVTQNIAKEIIKGTLEKTRSDMQEVLIQTSNFYTKFIKDYFYNFSYLTDQFKIMVDVFLSFSFSINTGICEEFCLKNENLTPYLDNFSSKSAFDVLVLYFVTKTNNFYVMMKHLNKNLEEFCMQLFQGTTTNIVEKNKLYYSSYFTLLSIRNIANNLTEINDTFTAEMEKFLNVYANVEITQENLFENLICISIYYEVILGFVKNLDSPANFVFQLLKKKNVLIKCHENHIIFYKNHFEYDERGKKVFDRYSTIYKKFELLIEKVENELKTQGVDTCYSSDTTTLSVINKIPFKSMDLECGADRYEIFYDISKFIIATLHSFENFKILI